MLDEYSFVSFFSLRKPIRFNDGVGNPLLLVIVERATTAIRGVPSLPFIFYYFSIFLSLQCLSRKWYHKQGPDDTQKSRKIKEIKTIVTKRQTKPNNIYTHHNMMACIKSRSRLPTVTFIVD